MNFLKLLLTIYFIVLSVVPCNDVHAQFPESSKETYSVLLNSEDSHSKDQGDICSPLCSCNCCQITVTSFKAEPLIPLFKNRAEYFSKKIHFQKNDFAYLVYDQIWQPPKI
ncbi:hypothetical protein ASG31_05410 [Chryseobacterium sp. Leaf404]|uniref:DUF6660 family protein n=1 Tax=unclassified Chryseobacterium TaxID=2593645 RepID=UPI0006F799B4|nr:MULTISPECIES: DUF6660 family protein [unclassified Chryseobacterium]KQT18171.1 hypothetical protein ASG31_05410 [Chryseobacterium sp. Leaf404]